MPSRKCPPSVGTIIQAPNSPLLVIGQIATRLLLEFAMYAIVAVELIVMASG
jgi:hypothetical protein